MISTRKDLVARKKVSLDLSTPGSILHVGSHATQPLRIYESNKSVKRLSRTSFYNSFPIFHCYFNIFVFRSVSQLLHFGDAKNLLWFLKFSVSIFPQIALFKEMLSFETIISAQLLPMNGQRTLKKDWSGKDRQMNSKMSLLLRKTSQRTV